MPEPIAKHGPDVRCFYCASCTDLGAALAGLSHPTIRMDLPEEACPEFVPGTYDPQVFRAKTGETA